MHTKYIPKELNFIVFNHSVSRLVTPFLGKVHRMIPNDFDMFKVKNTDMCATYTPPTPRGPPPPPKFILFSLRGAVFKSTEIFEFRTGYNVKIKLLITFNKL